MQKTGRNSWLLKKSYEIAYATFRIAAKMDERGLAENMKNAAIGVLGSAVTDSHDSAIKNLDILEYLVRFAVDVNIIGTTNGEVFLREIGELHVATEESLPRSLSGDGEVVLKTDEVDLSEMFPKEKPAIHKNEVSNGGILKSAIRQSAILERIRQIGNCRIKDIEDILPDSSERTIRYDLQTLIEQDLVERVGAGGPAVFYRIRQTEGQEEEVGKSMENSG